MGATIPAGILRLRGQIVNSVTVEAAGVVRVHKINGVTIDYYTGRAKEGLINRHPGESRGPGAHSAALD